MRKRFNKDPRNGLIYSISECVMLIEGTDGTAR